MVVVFMYAKTLKRDLVQRNSTMDKEEVVINVVIFDSNLSQTTYYQKIIIETFLD